MNIYLKKYNNPVRMSCAIDKLSEFKLFRFMTLRGSVFKKKDIFNCKGEEIAVLISFITDNNETMMTLLYLGDIPELDGKDVITFKDIPTANIYKTLIDALIDKFQHTNNWWELDLRINDNTVLNFSAKENIGIKLDVIRNNAKLISTTSMSEIKKSINDIKEPVDIIRFNYKSSTIDGGSKIVEIKNSNSELYRELSRYLNKTIVLVSKHEDKFIEQYINHTGIVEVVMNMEGLRQQEKKPIAKMTPVVPFCMYLSNISVNK